MYPENGPPAPPFSGFERSQPASPASLPGAFFAQVLVREPVSVVRIVWYMLDRSLAAAPQTEPPVITASYRDLEAALNLSHSSVCDGLKRALAAGYLRQLRPGENGHLKAQYTINWASVESASRPQPSTESEATYHTEGQVISTPEETTFSAPTTNHPVSRPADTSKKSYQSENPTAINSNLEFLNRIESVESLPAGAKSYYRPGPALPPYLLNLSETFSRELGDEGHHQSNRTQTLHLWQGSGLAEKEFARLFYEARDRTRRHAVLRPGEVAPPSGQPRNRMAYFFTVLRHLLTSPPQPAALPPPARSVVPPPTMPSSWQRFLAGDKREVRAYAY